MRTSPSSGTAPWVAWRSVFVLRGGRRCPGSELAEPPVVDGGPGPVRTQPLEDGVDEAHEFRMRLADPQRVGLVGELVPDDHDARILSCKPQEHRLIRRDRVHIAPLKGACHHVDGPTPEHWYGLSRRCHLELDVTVVPEDRPAYLLCDVNVEALELVGGWIQIAEQQRVLRDSHHELAALEYRLHERACGEVPWCGH